MIYFVFMMGGAFGYRLPPPNWRPDGWTPPPENAKSMITKHQVHLRDAHKTPQFWLVWFVLMLNVSAGIGVIGMASPMLQEIFAGSLFGQPDVKFGQLNDQQRVLVAAIAAGFTGLLSLFNIGGRFFWASLSDKIGRKMTYYTFFALGIALYAAGPGARPYGQPGPVRAGFFCIILSMYGGGFATVPAYLADLFGTQFVGAIHGRLLTAWSTAGIVGPVVVNYIREFQINAGVPRAQVYDFTMYILAGMLVVGFICNLMIKPVDPRWYMKEEEVAGAAGQEPTRRRSPQGGSYGIGKGGLDGAAVIAWLIVGVPIALGRLDHAVQGVGAVRLVRLADISGGACSPQAPSALSRRRRPPPCASASPHRDRHRGLPARCPSYARACRCRG